MAKEFSFSNVKIHNEIELFAVTDMKVKKMLEHSFWKTAFPILRNGRTSLYQTVLLGRRKKRCTFDQ